MAEYNMNNGVRPLFQEVVTIQSDLDIVLARSTVRAIARGIGFGPLDQSRMAMAVSDLARSIVLAAGAGWLTVRVLEREGKKGIEIEVQEGGEPSSDGARVMPSRSLPALAVPEGNTVVAAKRLMDEWEMQSQVGAGMRICCRKWRR